MFKMKVLILWLSIVGIFGLGVTDKNVESKVYRFSTAKVEHAEIDEQRKLIEGETTHLEHFDIYTTTFEPGKEQPGNQIHAGYEEVIFVKEGQLKISVNNDSKVMGPGSVALIMPGDAFGLQNGGDTQATCYIIKYKSKSPVAIDRGKSNGNSMLIDWDSVQFKTHDKGGVRKFFDRKSAMSERIEMHVTTLNPAIKSHEPHTHGPAEIVIMMKGDTEMEIGEGVYPGRVGDIYFLGSNIPHVIRNTGAEPCMYLAFQWE
jgi:(S)-ureidoglycine aminohydrolase